nr:EOG090X0IT3 [Lepidurus arcticus]
MTTASRPTFAPAQGGTARGEVALSALSKQYSSRDLPGHNKLKYRDLGQGTTDEVRGRDFRRELDDRERTVTGKDKRHDRERGERDRSDRDRSGRAVETSSREKKTRVEQAAPANLDADEAADEDSEDEDDDEDDTAELMAELQRIKQERAAEQAKREMEKRQEEERIRTDNILKGNPLLNYASSAAAAKADMRVKRRWDEDVVFKNCSRAEPEKKARQFINDTLRSEFHKKFMEKYIK